MNYKNNSKNGLETVSQKQKRPRKLIIFQGGLETSSWLRLVKARLKSNTSNAMPKIEKNIL